MNAIKYNSNFTTIDSKVATLKDEKSLGVINAIKSIKEQIESYKAEYNINDRKAKSAAKNAILNGLKTKEINPSLNRAYTIALTIVMRDIQIHFELLSVAQIENLANHGGVKGINELYKLDKETYALEVKDYLKSLKTREVITKTFEKKGK